MKNKIIVFTFLGYIFIFGILGIVFKDMEISYSERRKLKTFPNFSFTNTYVSDLDKYFLDHFPFRDTFRSIKAKFNYNVLNKLDNNGIYLKDNYIFKSLYPTNNSSIDKFINVVNKLGSDFKGNKYLMVIPDKNYYLNDDNFLHIDYEYLYNKMDDIGFINIDIRDIMKLDDYYYTDTHWKQENLDKVIEYMGSIMDFKYVKDGYIKNTYDKFYGVYYGESALGRNPEVLTYLTNDVIDNAYVKYLENDKLDSVYNINNLSSMDSYNVYLDGASSFIEIYNDNSISDRELIIFRDSFGSSIAPLLIKYYSKITLIDNRYISKDNYSDLIEIKNQDVLFMYSTLIVNNSSTLKG
ncbi:MAG: hypothetical protein IJZ36_03145 [Bacilli bacterium]|nr:hypothetical protein [Bacilli bacterium]